MLNFPLYFYILSPKNIDKKGWTWFFFNDPKTILLINRIG